MTPRLLRRRPRAAAAALLGAVLLAVTLAPVAPAGAAEDPWGRQPDDPIVVARDQRRDLQQRIEEQDAALERLDRAQTRVQAALAETTETLEVINADLGALRAEITAAEADLAAAEDEHADLVAELRTLDWTLELLAAQADELEADLVLRRGQLAARLAAAYVVGHTTVWEQVIAADSIFDAAVEQEGHLAFSAQDAALARSIERDQELLAEQRRGIAHVRYDTEELRQQVAERAAGITVARDQLRVAETHLARLEAETARLQAEQQARHAKLAADAELAAQLLADQLEAEAKLADHIAVLLEEERHAGRLPSRFNGTFRWPLIGRITQEFGCTGFEWEPPWEDCEHFHKGIDVVGPWNSPVLAPGEGIVLFVGFDPGGHPDDPSWVVVIAHSERLMTTYGHLQPRAPRGIRAGVRVRAGQRIGWMGNTGHSTGAHLHWGVWFDDEPVDPRYFL